MSTHCPACLAPSYAALKCPDSYLSCTGGPHHWFQCPQHKKVKVVLADSAAVAAFDPSVRTCQCGLTPPAISRGKVKLASLKRRLHELEADIDAVLKDLKDAVDSGDEDVPPPPTKKMKMSS